eukprot:scaffold1307_cov200-Pinguiococcus_pyrenoidosus.AAC.67
MHMYHGEGFANDDKTLVKKANYREVRTCDPRNFKKQDLLCCIAHSHDHGYWFLRRLARTQSQMRRGQNSRNCVLQPSSGPHL